MRLSRASWRTFRLALVGALCALLSGCALLQAPGIPDGHPARPEHGDAEVPPIPSILDIARADRRDPTSRPSTLLHPGMPMHEMDHQKHGQGGQHEH